MKKINFTVLTLLTICSIAAVNGYAQTDNEVPDLKVFGIGLHAQGFNFLYAYTAGYSTYTTNLLFPLNLTQHFRLEPEMGVLWMKNKGEDFNGEETEDNNLGISSGLGLFGMFQRGKVNFYSGIRCYFSYGELEGFITYNGESATEKISTFGIGPYLGFEYFPAENFSFGGEFGLPFISSNTKTKYPEIAEREDSESTDKLFTFNTGLFVRVYF